MIDDKTQSILQERLDRNAKSLLQELSQGRMKVTPMYRLVETRGPDHAREFTVEAMLGSQVYGVGHGRNKQAAEQDAARNAIMRLEEEFHSAAEAEARAALDALTQEVNGGNGSAETDSASDT
jgi:ribonuclease-3